VNIFWALGLLVALVIGFLLLPARYDPVVWFKEWLENEKWRE
jgi:hypothetical protein